MATWFIGSIGLVACVVAVALISSIEMARAAPWPRRPGTDADGDEQEDARYAAGALQLARIALVIGMGVCLLLVATDRHWPIAEVALTAIAAVPVWLVAHLLPRMLAKTRAQTWARWTGPPVNLLSLILRPMVAPGVWLARALSRLGCGAATDAWSLEELVSAARDPSSPGQSAPDAALLDSIIEFSDTVIREIMVPRTDMSAIPVTASPDDVATTVVERGHSRIPVYEETIDNVVGLLHVKDLFRAMAAAEAGGAEGAGQAGIDIRDLVRPTFYVPEVMKISELLREFQRRKTHMAIVVDEYGGTAGVVTLEDIIEEIVGEIQDEYDVEEKQFRVLNDEKIIADGRVQVSDLEEILGVHFPEDTGFETLAGFLMFEAGYLPAPGAVIDWNDLSFTIKEGNEKRIATVEIERQRQRDLGDGLPA